MIYLYHLLMFRYHQFWARIDWRKRYKKHGKYAFRSDKGMRHLRYAWAHGDMIELPYGCGDFD